MFVVVVWCEVHPAASGAFREAILHNREASLAERGCRYFDVSASENGGRWLLYELYDDRTAFDAHLASAHFAAFDAASRLLVAIKRVETYDRAH